MRNASAIAWALILAGCATSPPAQAPVAGPTLSSTEWRLIEFQSPKEAIGTIRPNQGEAYTLRFNSDGTLAAGLSCNRGSGRWSSPDAMATTGSINLDLQAVTQAACEPSPLERIGADLNRVRTFVIRDGRLHLNLMMDSGDYVWEPTS